MSKITIIHKASGKELSLPKDHAKRVVEKFSENYEYKEAEEKPKAKTKRKPKIESGE